MRLLLLIACFPFIAFAQTAAETETETEMGTLEVVTWPKDAQVEVVHGEETVTAKTPYKHEFPPATLKVSVTLDGHESWEQEVDIQVGQTAKIEACLDPVDQLVNCQRLIDVGAAPKSVYLEPDGSRVWVALLNGPPSLEVYDVKTGEQLAQLTLAKHGGVEIEQSASGELMYVSQMETHRVYTLHRKTLKLLGYYDTEGSWPKVVERTTDGDGLFISNWITNDVSMLDLTNARVSRIATVKTPRGLWAAPDGKHLYVAGFGSGSLAKIDLEKKKSTTLFTGGKAMRHIVADMDTNRLFISDLGLHKVYTLNLETDEVEEFVETNRHPNTIDLSPDGKILFVSCRGKNGKTYLLPGPEWGSILLYDTKDGTILDAIVGGNQPTGLDVSDDGKTLVTSDLLDNKVRVYTVPSYETLIEGKGGRSETHRDDLAKKESE